MTVQRWAERLGNMMESYLNTLTPMAGEDWRTDEVYVRVRGERKYLFAMLDSETRY